MDRKTELRNFANIEAAKVVVANEKLYMNAADGFIGTGLKKDEYVCDCSDIDDIIVFLKERHIYHLQVLATSSLWGRISSMLPFSRRTTSEPFTMWYISMEIRAM